MIQKSDDRTGESPAVQPAVQDDVPAEAQVSEKKAKALKKRSARQQRIIDGLAELRSVSAEIAQSYLANLEASIDQVTSSIRDHQRATDKKRTLKGRTLKRIANLLDGLSFKPDKGRRKDLKRIESTVAELLRLVQQKKGR